MVYFFVIFQETGSTGNSWDFGSSGLLNTPVLKDRLLTDSIGVDSAGEEGFPVNAEHSYSLGGSNSTANSTFNGSDGDSMPESPLSLDDGKQLYMTFSNLLLSWPGLRKWWIYYKRQYLQHFTTFVHFIEVWTVR